MVWKKGESGNPNGRPKGSRNKLSEAFLRVLADDFVEHGQDVIETLRKDEPDKYVATVGRLMPKLMELSGPDGSEIPIQGRVTFVRSAKDE